jgi:hypothetical protein
MYISSMDTKITYLTLGAALEANANLLSEGIAAAFDKWSGSAPDASIYNAFFSCKLTKEGRFTEIVDSLALKAA